jgi:hypothetical protein
MSKDDGNDVRFHIEVRVITAEENGFLTFDFSGPEQPLLIRSELDLSGVETQRPENLATNFVGNIAKPLWAGGGASRRGPGWRERSRGICRR